MYGAWEERENKCHHESLGYWETRDGWSRYSEKNNHLGRLSGMILK